MKSRLLVSVLGAVALVWVVTALYSYRDARREIDALLDAHLAQAAALLVAQASHEMEDIKVERSPGLRGYGQQVAFQVWERGRRLRVRSAVAPGEPLSGQTDGFSDVEIGGRSWRVFSTWADKRRILIQVGEERAARDRLVLAAEVCGARDRTGGMSPGTAVALVAVFGSASLVSFGGGNTVLPELHRQSVSVHGWPR